MRPAEKQLTTSSSAKQLMRGLSRYFSQDSSVPVYFENAIEALQTTLTLPQFDKIICQTLLDQHAPPSKRCKTYNAEMMVPVLLAEIQKEVEFYADVARGKQKTEQRLMWMCQQLGLTVPPAINGFTISNEEALDNWRELIESVKSMVANAEQLQQLAERFQRTGRRAYQHLSASNSQASSDVEQHDDGEQQDDLLVHDDGPAIIGANAFEQPAEAVNAALKALPSPISSYDVDVKAHKLRHSLLFKDASIYLLQNLRGSTTNVNAFFQLYEHWQSARLELARQPKEDYDFLLETLKKPFTTIIELYEDNLREAERLERKATILSGNDNSLEIEHKHRLALAMQRLVQLMHRRAGYEIAYWQTPINRARIFDGYYGDQLPRDPDNADVQGLLQVEMAYSICNTLGATAKQAESDKRREAAMVERQGPQLIAEFAQQIYQTATAAKTVDAMLNDLPTAELRQHAGAIFTAATSPHIASIQFWHWLYQHSREVNKVFSKAYGKLIKGQFCDAEFALIEAYCQRLENIANQPVAEAEIQALKREGELEDKADYLFYSRERQYNVEQNNPQANIERHIAYDKTAWQPAPLPATPSEPMIADQKERQQKARDYLDNINYKIVVYHTNCVPENLLNDFSSRFPGHHSMYDRYLDEDLTAKREQHQGYFKRANHLRHQAGLLFPNPQYMLMLSHHHQVANAPFTPLLEKKWFKILTDQYCIAANRMPAAFHQDFPEYSFTQKVIQLHLELNELIPQRATLVKHIKQQQQTNNLASGQTLELISRYKQQLDALVEHNSEVVRLLKKVRFTNKKQAAEAVEALQGALAPFAKEQAHIDKHYGRLLQKYADLKAEAARRPKANANPAGAQQDAPAQGGKKKKGLFSRLKP